MAGRLSRRSIARYAAGRVAEGDTAAAVKHLAAYLVSERRTKELDLLVRDIEHALAERGIVIADVFSSRPLSDSVLSEIKALAGRGEKPREVHLRLHEDESLLGGVVVRVPGAELDGSLRGRINNVKALQNEISR